MFAKTLHRFSERVSQLNIVWSNVLILATLHSAAVYGIFLKCYAVHLYSRIFFLIYSHISGWGVTAGRHRYFSHQSYKGNKVLDILLMLMACTAFEQSIFTWARDHRLHHKHSETDADPYNSKRGFFFSHMGWTMVRKHNDIKEKGKSIDMSDLQANPVVMFEYKYCVPLALLFTFMLPTFVPWYFWNETFLISLFYCTLYRFTLTLHITWSVNSFAHFYGMRTYDRKIAPAENHFVSTLALGEGFHNYHHTFPWDYKTAELGGDMRNVTTMFIDFLALIGIVTERKTATKNIVDSRKQRTGDPIWQATRKQLKSFLYCAFYLYVVA